MSLWRHLWWTRKEIFKEEKVFIQHHVENEKLRKEESEKLKKRRKWEIKKRRKWEIKKRRKWEIKKWEWTVKKIMQLKMLQLKNE